MSSIGSCLYGSLITTTIVTDIITNATHEKSGLLTDQSKLTTEPI